MLPVNLFPITFLGVVVVGGWGLSMLWSELAPGAYEGTVLGPHVLQTDTGSVSRSAIQLDEGAVVLIEPRTSSQKAELAIGGRVSVRVSSEGQLEYTTLTDNGAPWVSEAINIDIPGGAVPHEKRQLSLDPSPTPAVAGAALSSSASVPER